MDGQLRHLPASRFARAAAFADANGLRYVARARGLVQDRQPAAPYLDAFAEQELARVLGLVHDFHAEMVHQLTGKRHGALKAVTDRVQALIGALELARIDK
jgi:hypothetical protein